MLFFIADKESDISKMTTEAILLTVQNMIESGDFNLKDRHNNHNSYTKNNEYDYCDTWVFINVDLSSFAVKQKQINITFPDILKILFRQ